MYKVFRRSHLMAELERVLAVPIVEAVCFSWVTWQDRETVIDAWNVSRLYREQSSGSAWAVKGPSGEDMDTMKDAISLNISIG